MAAAKKQFYYDGFHTKRRLVFGSTEPIAKHAINNIIPEIGIVSIL